MFVNNRIYSTRKCCSKENDSSAQIAVFYFSQFPSWAIVLLLMEFHFVGCNHCCSCCCCCRSAVDLAAWGGAQLKDGVRLKCPALFQVRPGTSCLNIGFVRDCANHSGECSHEEKGNYGHASTNERALSRDSGRACSKISIEDEEQAANQWLRW